MSSDNENPWESAANDQRWNENQQQQQDEFAGTEIASSPRRTAATSSPSSPSPCWKIPYTIDLILVLTVGAYGIFCLIDGKMKTNEELFYGMTATWIICGLGFFRSFVAGRSATTNSWMHGMIRSSHGLAAVMFLTLSLTFWIFHWKSQKQHSMLDDLLPWSHTKHPKVLPSIFLGLGLWEGLRYVVILSCSSSSLDEHNDPNVSRSSTSHTSRRSSPWWWSRREHQLHNNNNNNQSTQPLLDATGNPHWSSEGRGAYEMDHGTGSGSSSWWPFGQRRSNNHNPRDDGSVDYASLSEDWASRSQDDPFWWTREEGGSGRPTEDNPGWAGGAENGAV